MASSKPGSSSRTRGAKQQSALGEAQLIDTRARTQGLESRPATHRLEWTKIFEDYLKLFEDVLASFIDKKGGNYAAFYRECREKQEEGTPEEKHFLKLLLASADYQDFSRIMVREARYYYSTGISHFGYVPPEAVEMDDKYQDPRFAKGK